MRLNLSLAQIGPIVVVVVVLALLSAWFFFGATTEKQLRGDDGSGTEVATKQRLVLYATQPSVAKGPIVPNVITTATKLGQGQKAEAGQPTSANFERPTLSTNSAGSALIIPGSALPGSHWVQPINKLSPLTSGKHPRLKYDMYSWSMGTLVATTPQWIDLAQQDADAAIPPVLLGHIRGLAQSERVMLVIAPQADADSGRYKAPLNRHDAYIVIADVLVPAP